MWLLSFGQKTVICFALDPSSSPYGDTEPRAGTSLPAKLVSHLGNARSSPTQAFQFSEGWEPSRHSTTTLWDSKVRTAQLSYFQTNKNHKKWEVIIVDLIHCLGAFLMHQLINYMVTFSYHSVSHNDGHEVALLWEDLKASKVMQVSIAGRASAGQLSSLLFPWIHHRQVEVGSWSLKWNI